VRQLLQRAFAVGLIGVVIASVMGCGSAESATSARPPASTTVAGAGSPPSTDAPPDASPELAASPDDASPVGVTTPRSAVPEGALVVPWDPDGDEQYKLYVVGSNGAAPRRLTLEDSEISGAESGPAWSPTGDRVVFVGYVRDGVDLFVINADGSALTNLTNAPAHYNQPTWSPDGSQIAFVGTDDGSADLYVMQADGSNLRRLTKGDDHDTYPAWSPDGRQIAFVRYHPGLPVAIDGPVTPQPSADATQTATAYIPAELMVMDADGAHVQALAQLTGADDGPQWSPDSAQLAFTNGFAPEQHVEVINRDGTQLHALGASGVHSSLPRWLPHGSGLSMVVTDPGGSQQQLVTMQADGAGAQPLSELHGPYAWSPAGDALVVLQPLVATNGAPIGRANLYLVATDGSPARLLLQDAALAQAPVWWPMLLR
jgi:TolB protein